MRTFWGLPVRARRVALIVVAVVVCSGRAVWASPIRFEFRGVGTGSVGDTPFSHADFAIDLNADTSNVIPVPGKVYSLDGAASFSVAGAGSGQFLDGARVFSNYALLPNTILGLSRPSSAGVDLIHLFERVPVEYDLKGPHALIRQDNPPVFFASYAVPTTLGVINFSSIDFVTFRAVLVPEPTAPAAVLCIAAALARPFRLGRTPLATRRRRL